MAEARLYIVHGMGSDSVGLVGTMTTQIAEIGGNIVDLRQDVLHGLFTIFMVVDLSGSSLRIDDFRKMINHISEDTGLALSVEKYVPIARIPKKNSLLLIIVGNDKPGIIATISKLLSQYQINIEFSQNIAREGIFLMELLTDTGKCSIPLDNLRKSLSREMDAMGMQTIFQAEDVFNKQKRVILFDIASSFFNSELCAEIIRQTDLEEGEISTCYSREDPQESLRKAASLLEGFPFEVMNSIIDGITVSAGTQELIQTFQIMGYKCALVCNGFSHFADSIRSKLNIKYGFGIPLPIDDDAKTITGTIGPVTTPTERLESIIETIIKNENISRENLTVISDTDLEKIPGIRLQFDQVNLLEYYNDRIINREGMLGLIGSFGLPPV